MDRPRSRHVAAVAVAVALLAVSGVAAGLNRVADPVVAVPTSTTGAANVTTATTTAPPATPTTATPTPAPGPPVVDDGVLVHGDRGPEVEALQRRLAELHFDAGVPDGAFGIATLYAVQGFQKLAGLAPDGRVGPEVQAALASPPTPAPLVPHGEPTRVEVDKQRQLLFLWVDGNLDLISHVSTGSGKRYCVEGSCRNRAITPEGAFRFMWRYKGWRQSRLGRLYNPVYFTGSGVAIHGATSVPTHPASHGCVRIPMHIAEWFPSRVRKGDPVYVLAHAGAPVGSPPTTTTTTTSTTSTTTTTTSTTTTTTAPSATATTTVPIG